MKLLASVAVIFLAALSTATAQTTCDILARNLPQDVLIQGSTSQQFEVHQNVICNQENSSWGTNQNKKLNASITVPDYVDAVLGTDSTAQNWAQNFSAFCSLQAGSVTSNQAASNEVRRASAVAYNQIVQCVAEYAKTQGIFAGLEINAKRDGFVIDVHNHTKGSSGWWILGVNSTPDLSGFKCREGVHEASIAKPKRIDQASWKITCDKDPHANIQVAVNTSEGSLPTFKIASINDELNQVMDRLTSLESRSLPNNTVAWFALEACPSGWSVYVPALGRTIIGANNINNRDTRNAVISSWPVGATGGEESHQLKIEEIPAHTHTVVLQKMTNYVMSATSNEAIHPTRIPGSFDFNIDSQSAGGNKPYNNVPPFVALTPCIKK